MATNWGPDPDPNAADGREAWRKAQKAHRELGRAERKAEKEAKRAAK